MANPFLVTHYASPTGRTGGGPKVGNIDTVAVYAEDATQAAQIVQSQYRADANAEWAAGAAELQAGQSLDGITFSIHIENGGSDIDVEYVALVGDTNVDTVGAALVTALNATAINGAAYNTGTNVLTIAETTDNLGDKAVTVSAIYSSGGIEVDVTASFWSTIVDEGASNAALKATLVAGTPPGISATMKSYS